MSCHIFSNPWTPANVNLVSSNGFLSCILNLIIISFIYPRPPQSLLTTSLFNPFLSPATLSNLFNRRLLTCCRNNSKYHHPSRPTSPNHLNIRPSRPSRIHLSSLFLPRKSTHLRKRILRQQRPRLGYPQSNWKYLQTRPRTQLWQNLQHRLERKGPRLRWTRWENRYLEWKYIQHGKIIVDAILLYYFRGLDYSSSSPSSSSSSSSSSVTSPPRDLILSL